MDAFTMKLQQATLFICAITICSSALLNRYGTLNPFIIAGKSQLESEPWATLAISFIKLEVDYLIKSDVGTFSQKTFYGAA